MKMAFQKKKGIMAIKLNTVERKRGDALIRIGQNVVGTSLTAAVPTPALETTKMIGIAVADAWMFWDIYKVYFDQRLSARRLVDMLGDAGIIVLSGGVIGYGVVKVSQSLIGELLNLVPLVGWAINGAMTGMSTAAIGLAWMVYVEEQFKADYTRIPVTEEAPQVEDGPKAITEPRPRDLMEPPPHALLRVEENGHQREPVAEKVATEEEETVLTLHPKGKRGVMIEKHKYQTIREAIIRLVREQDEITLKELTATIDTQLGETFDGAINWYVTTVKLDLEARQIIERVPKSSPQKLRMV